jgi:hypothetical protein
VLPTGAGFCTKRAGNLEIIEVIHLVHYSPDTTAQTQHYSPDTHTACGLWCPGRCLGGSEGMGRFTKWLSSKTGNELPYEPPHAQSYFVLSFQPAASLTHDPRIWSGLLAPLLSGRHPSSSSPTLW